MKEEFNKGCDYFRQHPAVLMSLTLLYISTLGLLFKIFFLKQLGVSALDFLVSADFLIAFIKGLPAFAIAAFANFILIICTLLSTQIYDKGQTFVHRFKNHWNSVRYGEFFITFIASFFIIMATGKLSAKYYPDYFINCYQIETKSNSNKYDVIDSSTNYLFTLNNQNVKVIPRSQVLSISTCQGK